MKIIKRAIAAVTIAAFSVVVFAPDASATWSIVGVDPDTGEVGVAIASCVPLSALGDPSMPLAPVVLVPNVGAAVSQAQFNPAAPAQLRASMQEGLPAAGVMVIVVADEFDDNPHVRQHAVVTLSGTAAGFTGDQNTETALDRQAANVSVQGNILVSNEVVDDALDTFTTTQGELSARLVAALQAGAEAGGDSRCPEQTALFAHLAVAGPNDSAADPSVLLSFGVTERTRTNPVELLVQAYDAGTRQQVADTAPSTLLLLGALAGAATLTALLVTLGIRYVGRS